MTLRHSLTMICVLMLLGGLAADGPPKWRTTPDPPPMPTPRESGFAPVNGIAMYYAIYGHGSPILLIHGGLSSSDVWSFEIRELAARHEVIVADSRGHGRSGTTGEPLTYGLMASDYLALLNYLHVRQVAVVGWSDGAIIGLELAIHHPERLTALFAQAANASPDGLRSTPAAGRKMCAGATAARSAYQRLSPAPDQFIPFCEAVLAMWSTEPRFTPEQLASIRVPTAIVTGDHDDVVQRDHTEYLARTIPGARLIILRNVGHAALLQDPAEYIQSVLAFIDGTDGQANRATRESRIQAMLSSDNKPGMQ